MAAKLRWGVLSTAKIGLNKVIPGMQRGELCSVEAIASRDLATAQAAAGKLGIAKAYGSYEELLADPDVDAVYIPLPNHLHVPWTVKAAEAGKHVLCEKPISLTAAEAETLLEVRDRTGVTIGELRAVQGFFSYYNVDPKNIRNQADLGGGALMDIGCYMVHGARFAFEEEPVRVVAGIERDPEMKTDRLTSAILEFAGGRAVFTCSTQLVPYQRMNFLGTKGRIELEIPVNAPPDRETRIFVDRGAAGSAWESFAACDQYTLQGDAFARAALGGGAAPVPVENAIGNMKSIDAVFRSGASGGWERV
jgi:predicted dehydrogenase